MEILYVYAKKKFNTYKFLQYNFTYKQELRLRRSLYEMKLFHIMKTLYVKP
jgi:hypothetical protein